MNNECLFSFAFFDQVLRRYLVQNRDDYVKYNKIVGLITKLTSRLKVQYERSVRSPAVSFCRGIRLKKYQARIRTSTTLTV